MPCSGAEASDESLRYEVPCVLCMAPSVVAAPPLVDHAHALGLIMTLVPGG